MHVAFDLSLTFFFPDPNVSMPYTLPISYCFLIASSSSLPRYLLLFKVALPSCGPAPVALQAVLRGGDLEAPYVVRASPEVVLHFAQ